jgi:hypothetical protein
VRTLLFVAVLASPGLAAAQAPTVGPMFFHFTLMIDDPRLSVVVGPNLLLLRGESAPFALARPAQDTARLESSCTTTPSIGSTGAFQGASAIMRLASSSPACQRALMPAELKSMSFQ